MNKRLKHIGFIIVMVTILITTGCNNKKNNNNEQSDNSRTNNGITDTITSEPTASPTDKIDNIKSDGDKKPDDELRKDSTAIEPVVTKEVNIYTMNETTLQVESAIALVPADTVLTPEIIVDMVVDSFADRLVIVGIDSVTKKDDTVIVSFLKNEAPLYNAGSGLESTILDAIAQSLVDNLPEYPKVIFRAEGEAYATGHNEFRIDEVYLDNNRTN